MRFLIAVFLLCFCFQSEIYGRDVPGEGPAEKSVQTPLMRGKDAKKLLDEQPGEVIVVDVRTPGEYAGGHIPGARNINFFGPGFEEDILKLPKDKKILLYCKTGRRSEAATEFLVSAGYENPYSLINGLEAWEDAGGKLEKAE